MGIRETGKNRKARSKGSKESRKALSGRENLDMQVKPEWGEKMKALTAKETKW